MNTKTVYSTKAEKYAKYRWDYAAGAIEAIFEITRLSAQSALADVGAGTGILTRHFVEEVQTLYAIEPNRELRQILETWALFPSVSVINGSAENTTLPDGSVDVITVAQAIHWFDPEPTRRELMRILKKDGWLVLLRNYGTNKTQNEAIGCLMTEEYGADFSVGHQQGKVDPARFYFTKDGYQKLTFPFHFNQSWDEFIGALTTASFMPDEDHPLIKKLEAKAREIFSQHSQGGYWRVEGETEVLIGQPAK